MTALKAGSLLQFIVRRIENPVSQLLPALEESALGEEVRLHLLFQPAGGQCIETSLEALDGEVISSIHFRPYANPELVAVLSLAKDGIGIVEAEDWMILEVTQESHLKYYTS